MTYHINKIRKYHHVASNGRHNILSYERVQHLVDVDANIFAAFVIDPIGSISHIFIAPDSDLNKSKIEEIASVLDIKSAPTSKKVAAESLIGQHKWDILEYEKLKFIKLYPSGNLDHKMIVVIAALTKDPGDVIDSVIGYMYESKEEPPLNLFD
jgi:hypothetical protein